ncbi:MAG: hypothetical protein GY820_31155, partial [Gammaproteobacteria bacterium]|nr:hypothetical protein [Gammaproteobacteria bacterium]
VVEIIDNWNKLHTAVTMKLKGNSIVCTTVMDEFRKWAAVHLKVVFKVLESETATNSNK